MKSCAALLLAFVCCACVHDNTVGTEYIGKPYLRDPLGEGVMPDADPVIRFDAFDCVTFVETVLADGDVERLNKIRYKNGVVNIVNRNHFIETDWLPNNSDLLVDVTEKYGKTSTRTVTIDRANWIKRKYGIDDNTPAKTVVLKYISYDAIKEISNSEPLVVLFIRDKRKNMSGLGTDLAVGHMGFLLPGGVLRHASQKAKRVVDVNFMEYINRIMENKNNLGIMLMEIKK